MLSIFSLISIIDIRSKAKDNQLKIMAEQDFDIGDLVWAKMKSFPFWPAQIVNPPTVKGKIFSTKGLQKKKPTYRKAQHYVFFFGSKNYAWILDENIVPHSEEMLRKVKKKKSVFYVKAIEEIVEASLAIVPKPELVKKDYVENRDLDKITEFPSIKEDELFKKPTIRFVKRGRTTKQKNGEKTKKSSQKRNLTEEATDEKLSQSKLCKIPPNNALSKDSDNPVSIVLPFADISRAASEYYELPPRPSLDLKKETMRTYDRPTSKKIGFVGLGMMGQRIVKNLLHSGHDISVWNRTPEKCEQFVDAGAKHFSTPADIVQNCDIIFCCVSGPEASKSLLYKNCGILEGLEKCQFGSKGYVELTNIDHHTSLEISEAISERGGKYLEAPVTGSLSLAEEGSLLILSAGDHELFRSCETCFFSISENIHYFGYDVGTPSKLNLIHSTLMGVANASLAETMALIDRMDLPKTSFLDAIKLDSICCPLFSESGQAIADQNFSFNTSLNHIQKNLHFALRLGSLYTQPLRLTSAANELYKKTKSHGLSDCDMSAAYLGAKK
ncbi:putative oxidoreductase GLYR1 homolog [Trichonephila inaurata madagascariensis]|uniref:Cytokine-like nuclear factor N-PAC n=1 Tax=Trichonephila inaurata madagascariensis TaxID=2747483 RepID=A0A8X6XMS2_9ARAC|nr:putative oxidoreductase GLYR1 homolog [Trichonephila inaurata madagascariensis]